MYTLDRLFDDLVRLRGRARADYEQVWDAFNRYVTTTLEQRQTLNVANFCKIGWRIEEFQGKARLRPHFQLAESFIRVFNVEAKSHPFAPERVLTTVEEFNFSKAAIRFSQSLTKDQIFMGLRAVVHQIGEAAAREQVEIEFEVGRLLCNDRDVQFVFAADLYFKEGLDVPAGSVEVSDYKPSVTFGQPSQDAYALSLQGSNQFSGTVRADHLGGWDDSEVSPRSIEGLMSPAKAAGNSGAMSECSDEVGRGLAQLEALSRYISKMESDAAKVVAEKSMWEGHLQRCNEVDRKGQDWRKALAREHQEQLKKQIREDEEKRAREKDAFSTKAGMHEFPSFREPGNADVRAYMHERRANLKEDLDAQVAARERMRQITRQRELELELVNIQAGQVDIERLNKDRIAKKEAEKTTLHQAWEQDVRLKAVKKAIDQHHKTPKPRLELNGLMSSITGSVGEVVSLGGLPAKPGTPRLEASGALSDRCSTAASSRASGSARRMPIGAAASLALQKEKMRSALRS